MRGSGPNETPRPTTIDIHAFESSCNLHRDGPYCRLMSCSRVQVPGPTVRTTGYPIKYQTGIPKEDQ